MQGRTRALALAVGILLGITASLAMATEALAATAADVIKVAETQLGVGENPPGSDLQKYGVWNGANGRPWCSEFASWTAHMAGARTAIGGRFSSARRHSEYFKSAGRFGATPRIGAYIFFDTDGDGVINHVGIVTAINSDGSVNTIEGNTTNMVVRRTRSGAKIVGYGYPAYSASATSTYYWVQMHAETADKVTAIQAKARELNLKVTSTRNADDGHYTLVAHASAAKASTLRSYAAALGQPMQIEATSQGTYLSIASRLATLVSVVYVR